MPWLTFELSVNCDKNIAVDKNFSYLTEHAEYLTLTFLVLVLLCFENKAELTFITNSSLFTYYMHTPNKYMHTFRCIHHI